MTISRWPSGFRCFDKILFCFCSINITIGRIVSFINTIHFKSHNSCLECKSRSKIGQKGQKGQIWKNVANCLKHVENWYYHWKSIPKPWFHHFNTLHWNIVGLRIFFRSFAWKFSKSQALYYEKTKNCFKKCLKQLFLMEYRFSLCFRPFPTFFEIWPFWPLWPLSDLYDTF